MLVARVHAFELAEGGNLIAKSVMDRLFAVLVPFKIFTELVVGRRKLVAGREAIDPGGNW